ncbi:MAG TPA: hypothetical protein VFF21_10370 [Flavobacteriaceae bacterium]|nr:hypothetical protein [Flavobacteriaceae bacterium]
MEAEILSDKLELIQWLSSIEDETVIRELMEFREQQISHKKISDAAKRSIALGMQQADEKKLKSHSEVRKVYEKWL